ncbi:DUF3090 domain-containing protein [Pilimelia columellifera]|uniref:DUF3090 domain-containing protein n=1 Tax=Pilimelia columellifera subsp. columellifera TaxID=706583 RepID=A0ABN3NMB7_9ACTN
MAHQVHAFEPPERFVAGTVGPPGERTFFLQARGGGRLVSVALEKAQVVLLADKLEELLAEARRRFDLAFAGAPPPDNAPLDTPVDEEFRVGTLGLAYDVDTATVLIEAVAIGEDDSTDDAVDNEDEVDETDADELIDADLDRLRVRLTPATAREFIDRARRVVSAGRPPCPLCGQPLNPDGHLCPRHNGYHR